MFQLLKRQVRAIMLNKKGERLKPFAFLFAILNDNYSQKLYLLITTNQLIDKMQQIVILFNFVCIIIISKTFEISTKYDNIFCVITKKQSQGDLWKIVK